METDYQSPLSMRYAADILAMVYENGKIMATDLLRIAKNYKTVSKTADALVDIGLMEMRLESGARLMKIYTLTPKGEGIGKRMLECRAILAGNEIAAVSAAEPETPKIKKKKKGKKKDKA